MDPVLSLKNVSCVRNLSVIFNNLNLEIYGGQLYRLIGSNGSGKSSLLKIIAHILPSTSGLINYYDYEQVIFIGHDKAIKYEVTVLDNVLFWANFYCQNPNDIDFEHVLKSLNLYHLKDMKTYMLSEGQRKRLSLSKLMFVPARLWLLDEPFTGLDQKSIAQVMSIIDNHVQNQGAVIIATHLHLELQNQNIINIEDYHKN